MNSSPTPDGVFQWRRPWDMWFLALFFGGMGVFFGLVLPGSWWAVVPIFLVLGGLPALYGIRVWRARMGEGEPPLAFDQEGISITSIHLVRGPSCRRVLWSEVDGFHVLGKDPRADRNWNWLIIELRDGGRVPITDHELDISIGELAELVQTHLADSKAATASIESTRTDLRSGVIPEHWPRRQC